MLWVQGRHDSGPQGFGRFNKNKTKKGRDGKRSFICLPCLGISARAVGTGTQLKCSWFDGHLGQYCNNLARLLPAICVATATENDNVRFTPIICKTGLRQKSLLSQRRRECAKLTPIALLVGVIYCSATPCRRGLLGSFRTVRAPSRFGPARRG
jgi:hypothetical protein